MVHSKPDTRKTRKEKETNSEEPNGGTFIQRFIMTARDLGSYVQLDQAKEACSQEAIHAFLII